MGGQRDSGEAGSQRWRRCNPAACTACSAKHPTVCLTSMLPSQCIQVVTWSGGWLCICGRICWPKQHCKVPGCGHRSPCRNWCFEGACDVEACRFPHPKFYLPLERPAVGPDSKTDDGRDLLQLPPPGTVPACMRKQVAASPARCVAPAAAALPLHQLMRFCSCFACLFKEGWGPSIPAAVPDGGHVAATAVSLGLSHPEGRYTNT